MRRFVWGFVFAMLFGVNFSLIGCGDDDVALTAADTDADTDTDSDTDTDADTDTDTDTDADNSDALPDELTDAGLEDCFEGDYRIETDADVTFFKNYPCIIGHLSVFGFDLVTLELPNLRYVVNGGFGMSSTSVETVDLSKLTTVDGTFQITGNSNLRSLSGVSSLTMVGHNPRGEDDGDDGSFHISGNDSLTDFDGVSKLVSVGGDLRIRGNTELISLSGLTSLTTVGGMFTVSKNTDLPQCEACNLLDNLVGFAGIIDVKENKPDYCLDACHE